MPDTVEYLLSTLALTDDGRTALERELVPIARAAALGALTGDIAHDLANPLFAVLGHVDLLLLDAEPGSELRERLLVIKETALELKDGLRALLDYAHEPEGEHGAELVAAARAAIALVCRGNAKELQVAARVPDEPVVVKCAPGALAQAALHLVAAARDTAGDGGSVELEVTSEGVLRVQPAARGGLGVVMASRIAADYGGMLVQDGDTLALHFPLWVAS